MLSCTPKLAPLIVRWQVTAVLRTSPQVSIRLRAQWMLPVQLLSRTNCVSPPPWAMATTRLASALAPAAERNRSSLGPVSQARGRGASARPGGEPSRAAGRGAASVPSRVASRVVGSVGGSVAYGGEDMTQALSLSE